MCAVGNKTLKILSCVNIIIVSKVLIPNLSRFLNKISTSQTLLSFSFGVLKLNITVIYFMNSG